MTDTQAHLAENARVLHRLAPASQIGGLVIAAAVLVVVWSGADLVHLIVWMGAILLSVFIRFGCWASFRINLEESESAFRWQRTITGALAFSGLVWAWGFLAFFQAGDALSSAALIGIAAALIGGAMGSLAPSVLAYTVYCLPISVALATAMFKSGDFHWFLCLCMILYFLVCLLYTWNMNRTIMETISLRFENQKLIGELTQQSEMLAEEAQKAKEADAAKSRFLAVASHDLAQPLAAIELFISAIERERDPERRAQLVSSAGRSASVLSELFTGLLDMSKLEADAMEVDLHPTSLEDVIEPLLPEFNRRAEKAGLAFRCEMNGDCVHTDRLLLQRVVLNLVNNAIDYTDEGDVLVQAVATDELVTVTISDSGPGIPEAIQPHVFKAYYQGENSKGTGLGLAIVERLCELLSIDLQFETSPQGTVFRLGVPKAPS